MIHSEAEKYLNRKAYDLITLIEEVKEEELLKELPKGSLGSKIPVDWTPKMDITTPMKVSGFVRDKRITLHEVFQGKRIGFSEKTYPAYVKFLKSVYGNESISSKVSFKFLHDVSFIWLLSTYKNKQAESEYCSFLFSKIIGAVRNLKLSFEVLHLEIEKPFKIGNVLFEFLTSDFFDQQQAIMQQNNLGSDISPLREQMQGKVFATCEIRGVEQKKAQELALTECYLAMDVLKLFSPTVTNPDWVVNFDISNRVNVHSQNEYFVQDIDHPRGLNLNFSRGATDYRFTEEYIDHISKLVENFSILITRNERNELQQLVINSITRFSEAMTVKSIHKRIVDLFTIWESLLLKDSGTPIMSLVSMYASKLLRSTIEERKEFISFIKKMYEVRSAMIHHAKTKAVKLEDVANFQMETCNLMNVILRLSGNFASKTALLDEIDNHMHGAFVIKP